jgi:hypothetical protein
MRVLKNIHVWGFLGFMSQLFVYVLFHILPYIETGLAWIKDYDFVILVVGAWLAFSVLALGHRKTWEGEKLEVSGPTGTSLAGEAVKILSSLYAVIAGLSLTTAIEQFASLKDIFPGLEITITFFVIAIPFYNGATMFLIRSYLRGFEGRRKEPLIDFFMLFLEAAALYGMAISITRSLNFIASFSFLLSVDVVWILYTLRRKWRSEAPPEWLWIDFYMLLFILWFFAKLPTGVLAAVAIPRTLVDYYVGRYFYIP